MSRVSGRHFLQIPGPTPVPDRVLRAMGRPVIDHRGPEFAKLGLHVLERVKTIFKTNSRVFIFPASGTGAWESSLTNTLNPGDKVLMFETGHFSFLWKSMAARLGLEVDYIESDWRGGVDVGAIEAKLREDKGHAIKAVCVVHNETSTGTTSHMDQVRKAIDAANHPALFMVDTVSSLAAIDYRHDEWGVDVAVCGSQKGLMLPPGLGFTAVSDKAMAASKSAKMHRAFFAWDDMEAQNKIGFFPYTPATSLLYGLVEAIDMLHEEGLDNVFARHKRYGEAVRAAVAHWGLDIVSQDSQFHSAVVTTILMPEAKGGDAFRTLVLEKFDVSLGAGLSKLADKIFRIGHIGDTNDLTIIAALAGVEMGLELAGISHQKGGVQVAMDYFANAANGSIKAAAE
jgi:alanine-glyoxylate transaminase/serine-glyoxylate transaminase/serine-pyruvate transaminase